MRKKLFALPFSLMTTAAWLACVGDDPGSETTTPENDSGIPQGAKGGPCFPNKTCNEGLVCQEGLVCLTKPGEPGSDGATSSEAGDATTSDASEGGVTCKKSVTFSPPLYKPPAPKVSGACTTGNIQDLATGCYAMPASSMCADARAGVSTTCSACAIGLVGDAQWKPIVITNATPPAFYNIGGCLDLRGAPANCGKSYVNRIACVETFCGSCEGGPARTACEASVTQNECAPYALDQACANAVTTHKACFADNQTAVEIRNQFVNLVTTGCQ